MLKSVIPVQVPGRSYDIAIAAGGLDELGTWADGINRQSPQLGKKMLVVSNPDIFEHYGQRTLTSLHQAGFQAETCILPEGEPHKTLGSIQHIYDQCLKHRMERSSTLIALGGGVIGDMTGFAAATWLRGIQFVQVPTSLLAMVDASVGGKTGVNHPQGKNLIGAFHQPRLVVIDPDVLQTLPDREFRAGMAEVIKYGVIWDRELFERLETPAHLSRLADLDTDLLQTILQRSCQAKADVVSQDEKEAGIRAILNYGHTIGHAIESLTGYSRVIHGEAVAIGMVAAGQIAVDLGMWTQAEANRQDALLQKTRLPTRIPADLDIHTIVDTLQTDKKVKGGKVRFVLPTCIGAVTITDNVPAATLESVLRSLQIP